MVMSLFILEVRRLRVHDLRPSVRHLAVGRGALRARWLPPRRWRPDFRVWLAAQDAAHSELTAAPLERAVGVSDLVGV